MADAIKTTRVAGRAAGPLRDDNRCRCSADVRIIIATKHRRRARFAAPFAPMLGMLLALAPASAAQPSESAATNDVSEQTVSTDDATTENRIDPVRAFGGYDERAAREAAVELMRRPLGKDERELLLGVLAARPASDPVLMEAVRALSATLDPAVVGAVIVVINDAEATARTIEVGLDALVRLTGKTDLATPEAWRSWWAAEGSALSSSELTQAAGRWQTERARLLANKRDDLRGRLADVYRRLYVVTSAEQRTPLLLELLDAEPAELRRLGFDLAERESISSRELPGEVIERALAALSDGSAMVRSSAATLLYTANPPAASPRAAELLAGERDPDTAAAMLRILARRPHADALPEILVRMSPASQPDNVVDSAVDAALRYHEAYGIDGQAGPVAIDAGDQSVTARDHTVAVLRSLAQDEISANGVTLLGALAGHEAVRGMLRSPRLPVAQAAAAALENDAESLGLKVEAAQRNPGLFEYAARAVMKHQPTAEGFAVVAALPATASGIKSERLLEFAASLPPGELIEVVSAEPELSRRSRYAESALTPAFFDGLASEIAAGEPYTGPRARLVRLLMRTRLDLKNPAGVLTLAERIPPALREQPWACSHRAASLVWLNRLDEARNAGGVLSAGEKASAWLTGLAGAVSMPHAADIIDTMRTEHTPHLSEAELERFEELAELVLPPAIDNTGTPSVAPNNNTEPVQNDQQGDRAAPGAEPRPNTSTKP